MYVYRAVFSTGEMLEFPEFWSWSQVFKCCKAFTYWAGCGCIYTGSGRPIRIVGKKDDLKEWAI